MHGIGKELDREQWKALVRQLTGLGLNHVQMAGSGSAPIPPDLITWYKRLGLNLLELTRGDLRIDPADAGIAQDEIDRLIARRKQARAEKDFAASDAIRDELAAKGVEVMDGDALGWEWKL